MVRSPATDDAKNPQPTQQVLVAIPQFSSSLLLDGSRARYETRIISLATKGKVSDTPFVSTFDGTSLRSLTGELNAPNQTGTIANGRGLNEWGSLALKAPLVVYRTLSPGVLYGRGFTMRVLPDTTVIQGIACRAVQILPQDSTELATVWCDLRRDALPLRCVKGPASGGLRCEVNISYAESPNGEQSLQGWETNFVDTSGAIPESNRATGVVVDLQPKIGVGDFAVRFPPGCIVWDKRLPGPKKMISNGGDNLRPFVPVDPKRLKTAWLYAGVGVGALVMIGAFAFRRMR